MPAEPTRNTVEIVENPFQVSRLLGLLPDGRAYLATWLRIKATYRDRIDDDGKRVELKEPHVEYRTEPVVATRDSDGKIETWGAMGQPIPDEWDIRLNYQPPSSTLLTPLGYMRLTGEGNERQQAPDPATLFSEIVDVFNAFMDFSFGIAEQQDTAKLMAVYVIGTWLSDAYASYPYAWPNGDKGSGKTKLLMLNARLGYLGQVILAGGSFAALRDLAEYGALLCFDDAENLADPRTSDPDKRALLLAGNRKGAVVPIKEPEGKNGWKIRNVSAYSPKMFSAIRLPDPTLGRRTIIIPMVRSGDESKANHDIEEEEYWPHDRRRLLDDLWTFGLHYLGAAKTAYNSTRATDLVGPGFEPWRPLLATARVLEDAGVDGLVADIVDLARSYQQEKGDLEYPDVTRIAVMAIAHLADVWTYQDVLDVSKRANPDADNVRFTATEVAKSMNQIAIAEGIADEGDEYTNAKKVGRILDRLRVKRDRSKTAKRTRYRVIKKSDAERLMRAYTVGTDVTQPPQPARKQTSNGYAAAELRRWLAEGRLAHVPGGLTVSGIHLANPEKQTRDWLRHYDEGRSDAPSRIAAFAAEFGRYVE